MTRGIPRLVVAGTHSGVGKTSVATGLLAALTARGLRAAGAKVGPDFIDPSYHALATGRRGCNLDAFLSGPELVAPLLGHAAGGADVAVVEGVMGLHDGASGRGETASTAQVAKLLDAPVVLVVDAHALGRSVAAMAHGYATFDPAVRVVGVIANQVGSDRHVTILREALEGVGLPLLGAVRRDPTLATPSRHLGLVPAAERDRQARETVARLGRTVAAQVDVDGLLAIARDTPPLRAAAWSPPARPRSTRIPVALAAGPAFSFVYQENLELLEAAGARLQPLDPTSDERLPEGTAALYLGGGFPEVYGEALSANTRLRAAVAAFAASGAPVLAECGGLLYLCQRLDGHPMCGVLAAEARLEGRLTLGYREATAAVRSAGWPAGARTRGHEFHHSVVTPAAGTPAADPQPAWQLDDRGPEGFVTRGVHASYLHTHWAATPEVPARLLAAAARFQTRLQEATA